MGHLLLRRYAEDLVTRGSLDFDESDFAHFNISLSPAMTAQSATYGGRAAAFGGPTTFIHFALNRGGNSLVAAIQDKQREIAADRPAIHYALHAMITGNTTFEVLDEIPDAISGGISSFKMFTTFSGSEAKPLSTAEIAGSLTRQLARCRCGYDRQ